MGQARPTGTRPGFAILCDRDGIIVRIIRNEIETSDWMVGCAFTSIVDEESRGMAGALLDRLRNEGAVLDWRLNVFIGRTTRTLHFAGGTVHDRLLIIAADTAERLMDTYEEPVITGTHLDHSLHSALESPHEQVHRARRSNAGLYDELSRLNNELAAMQREVAKKNAELERLNQLKNEFMGMAAHDLRNSLSAIQVCGELLRNSCDTLPIQERQEALDVIVGSSYFMAELLGDLLDVARIESGKLMLDMEATDLVTLAKRSLQFNRVLADAKDIELRLEHESLPTIIADPNMIGQVFSNLITNALKFSYAGTDVTVSLFQRDANHVHVTVSDEGQGIPVDQLDNLFQPFTTTTVRTTAGEMSSGMGLVIVRKIVEGHGGTISVDSKVGVGTTFDITLPVRRDV